MDILNAYVLYSIMGGVRNPLTAKLYALFGDGLKLIEQKAEVARMAIATTETFTALKMVRSTASIGGVKALKCLRSISIQ